MIPTIEIIGEVGSGKSALARAIMFSLGAYHIDVKIRDCAAESEEELEAKWWDTMKVLRGQSIQLVTRQSDMPALESHQQVLANFGQRVIEILKEHEEWSSDTTDMICSAAHEFDLATSDHEGMFKIRRRLPITKTPPLSRPPVRPPALSTAFTQKANS